MALYDDPSDPEPNGDKPHDDPTKRDKPHPNGGI